MEPKKQGSGQIILQLSVILIVFVAALAVLKLAGAFDPKTTDRHTVILKVTGSIDMAVISYMDEAGTSSDRLEVHLPWQYRSRKYASGAMVILTAGNPYQSGNLGCALYLDGTLWKEEVAKNPQDKVSCAGLVP